MLKESTQKNGFRRRMMQTELKQLHTIPAGYGLNSICGMTPTRLFFSDMKPGRILFTDFNLSILDTIDIGLTEPDSLFPLVATFIDSPNINILSGSLPGIITYNFNTSNLKQRRLDKFSKGVMLDSTQCVVSYIENATLSALFRKVKFIEKSEKIEADIFGKKGDAGFSMDGKLLYDKESHRLFHLPYYCNRVSCIDTNLSLLYEFATIDTNVTSKVDVVIGKNLVTNAHPPKRVNYSATISDGLLYVRSALKADNEPENALKNNAVIDIYAINSNSYIGSFYIPIGDNNRLKDFKIINKHTVVALYRDAVSTFQLDGL